MNADGRIRMDLANVIPQAMIPSVYVHVQAMPVTERGKIDYSRLPIPTSVKALDDTLPANELEEFVCEAFSEIFSMASVGAEASFFELGGNSLKGFELLAALGRRGYDVGMRDLLAHPTPRALAAFMRTRREGSSVGNAVATGAFDTIELPAELRELAADANVEAILPINNATVGYMLLQQSGITDRTNRIHQRVMLARHIDEAEFARRVGALVRNHPSLRSGFVQDARRSFWQVFRARADVPTYHRDLRGLSPAAQERLLGGFWQVMDEGGRPFEAACFPVADDRSVVLLAVDHTHADGMSTLVMANELADDAYAGLPVDGLIGYRRRSIAAGRHMPEAIRAYFAPEHDPARSPEVPGAGRVARAQEAIALTEAETGALVRRCAREGVTPYAYVQWCYGRALLALLGETEVWLLNTDSGRRDAHAGDLRIVGNLINVAPVCIRSTTTTKQLQDVLLTLANAFGLADADVIYHGNWYGIFEGIISQDFGELGPNVLSCELVGDRLRGGNRMTMADGRLRITLGHADEPERNAWYRELAGLLRAGLLESRKTI